MTDLKKEYQLSEEAKAAKRRYDKMWREKNPDKVRAIRKRYWEKRAAEEVSTRE